MGMMVVTKVVRASDPFPIVGTYDHAELLPQRRDALEWRSDELAILAGKPEMGTGLGSGPVSRSSARVDADHLEVGDVPGLPS